MHPLQPLRWRNGVLWVVDQTALPFRLRWLQLKTAGAVAAAIKRLAVRGAPAIGVAVVYGLALAAGRESNARNTAALEAAARTLVSARPTAVNLRWAVERVMSGVRTMGRGDQRSVLSAARRLEQEEVRRSHVIARHGATLVKRGATVLTICNTGPLAAPGLGTALGVILKASAQRKRPVVYACETRPLLQGARLTVFELQRAGVDVRLIVDSAAATAISRCDLVLAGADRIARNGDTANKVGTRMLALLARHAGKPFYIAAPVSTFDLACGSGDDIPIEERPADEVRVFGRCRTTSAAVPVFNPAFDVTPGRMVTAFITDRGLVRPPYRSSIRRLATTAAR